MKYIENKEEFKEAIADGLVLVDFYATWCGPCQMLSPILEQLEKENKDLTIVKVDVDKHPELAKEHGVLSIPVLEFYKKSKMIDKAIGYLSKEEIEEKLK